MVEHSVGSVSGWIEELKQRDKDAQAKIWTRFVERLVAFANRKLRGSGCRVADADDVASLAFQNFFLKAPEEFGQLVNRNDLWRILAMLAERRAIDQIRKEFTLKNGRGLVISESVLTRDDQRGVGGLDSLPSHIEPPDLGVILAEETEQLLDSLDDDILRKVAISRLENYENREIAEQLKMSLRSVERKLNQIRSRLQAMVH